MTIAAVIEYLIVAVGSALGGGLRYALAGIATPAPLLPDLPLDTILINILGSFVIGVAAGLAPAALGPRGRQFVMVGLCGGFTTFSAFSVQNMILLQSGAPLTALVNVLASVLICLLATAVGVTLGDSVGAA